MMLGLGTRHSLVLESELQKNKEGRARGVREGAREGVPCSALHPTAQMTSNRILLLALTLSNVS